GARAVLPAGSSEPESIVNRRECGRVRRRSPRVQVRYDEAVCAGARSRVANGRGHPHRVQGGEERRRVRPDAIARRLRRYAGDYHEDYAAAAAKTAGERDI